MSATDDGNRGEEPYIFPDERPEPADCDGDGDLYVLHLSEDGSPESWKFGNASRLKHNTIWAPGNHGRRVERSRAGNANGEPSLPLPIKILALRGE